MEEPVSVVPVPHSTPPRLPAPSVHARALPLKQASGDALVLRGIVHDVRNLVTALRLCSELIAEPGVLPEPHAHFAAEICSIAEASQQLMRRLSGIAHKAAREQEGLRLVQEPIADLPTAVRHLAALLSAIAGPLIGIDIACLPCPGALRLGEEDLTRILLNLVRNAVDAMPRGGHIRITVQRGGGASFFWTLSENDSAAAATELWGDGNPSPTVLLTMEDDGPGIPRELLERVFEPGFSTRRDGRPWPEALHHGLGLSLVRELVEEAGGSVRAVVRPVPGTRIEIELPLTNVTPSLPSIPVQNPESAS
jgi:signal transduction histidine kinase